MAAAIALASALAFVSCCIPGRPIEAGLVLNDMASGGKSGRLQRERPPPRREEVSYSVAARLSRGDLYRCGEDWKSALVLVPGAADEGKDDPRLVAFAGSLARARFVVLVPDMPNVRQFQLGVRDIRDIADAVAWLASRDELSRGKGVGIAAVSYAVGPAVLAALESDARQHTSFVFGIGGYFNLERAITFLTTGCYREEGDAAWRRRDADPHAKWLFAMSIAARLRDPHESEKLARIARECLRETNALVEPLVQQLGPETAAVYRVLVNDDPDRVKILLQQVPAYLRSGWEQLDLATADLSRLRARVILVHGRDDMMIPYTESIALAEAAPHARVFVVDALAHVDLGRVGFLDAVRLWRATGALLAVRGREPRCDETGRDGPRQQEGRW